ncbi:MAG: xylose operon transcription regulator XylR, partial [Pirellulales bacterium]
MAEYPRVALDVETSLVYGRQILDGVARYMRGNRPWSVYVEQHDLGSDLNGLLKRWTGDGIITRQVDTDSAKVLRRRKIAAVDTGDILPHHGILRIGSADLTIGRIAADHLLERGFSRFGCCGFTSELWSQKRRDGFVAAVESDGHQCSVFELPRTSLKMWKQDQA